MKDKTTAAEDYSRQREYARKHNALMAAYGRDIGEPPAVLNPERREACRENLRMFLETYFAEKFPLAWSADHKVAMEKIETAVLRGGLFALAMPRGSGKTTICERAALWAVLYGHRRFVALIGATEDAARSNLDEVKMEVECNDLLLEDFPEVCFPVRKLEGIGNRCAGQTCMGERTRITWTDGEAVFPTVPGSVASGAVIQVRGITGRLRGMKAAVPSGASIRPDLVLIDDPQTDESSASPEQNRKRLHLLLGAILGLAGPGVKIAGVMPCTVIHPGDMADEVLDRTKHPEWNGERRKLLVKFPSNMQLWNKYAELWADGLRDTGTIDAATAYYAEHQADMDAGAEVSWPERHNADELTGIQYAMDLYIRDRETFFAEYQNEPLRMDEDDTRIEASHVIGRIGRIKRGMVPVEAETVVTYIDVQGKCLFWLTAAFADDYTAWVIDYGTWPEQSKRYFSLKDLQRTYVTDYSGMSLEGAIYNALEDLTDRQLGRVFLREDGTEMKVSKCLIDSAWGESTSTVYRFCKDSTFSNLILPSKGRGITAAQKPFTEYRRVPGEKLGYNWRVFKVRGQQSARVFEYDTNFWKSFFRTRLFTKSGDSGCLTLFAGSADQHRLLADHWSAETSTKTIGNGRTVDAWSLIPGRENHWLDCVVGCYVQACSLGCKLKFEGAGKIAPAPAKKIEKLPKKIVLGGHIGLKK